MWEDRGIRDLLDAHIFTVREVIRKGPEGREAPFVRVDAPDWVTIIPEVPGEDGEPAFVIVRQYRHGSGRLSLEFPAGAVDRGEPASSAAHRELLEETGYAAGEMEEIGRINPNPAFMSNVSSTFLATDLSLEAEPDLDDHEHLDFRVVPYRELAAAMGSPPYDSAIMVQAWYWYLRHAGRILDEPRGGNR